MAGSLPPLLALGLRGAPIRLVGLIDRFTVLATWWCPLGLFSSVLLVLAINCFVPGFGLLW